MLLSCGVGEDSWVSWTARRSNLSILKEISPECSLEGLMLKLKLQYFGHLMWRVDSFVKTLMLGKIECRKERGPQRMRWLDGIIKLVEITNLGITNSGSWWWTGRSGVLWSMGLQRVRHDWVVELNWKDIWEISMQVCLLRNLYAGQETTGITGYGIIDWFQIVKEVYQGCIFSPCLFNLHEEYIMRNAWLDEAQTGIKRARRNINNLSDITLMAENEELKGLLMKVKMKSENLA